MALTETICHTGCLGQTLGSRCFGASNSTMHVATTSTCHRLTHRSCADCFTNPMFVHAYMRAAFPICRVSFTDLKVAQWSSTRKWAYTIKFGFNQTECHRFCQSLGGSLMSIMSATEKDCLMAEQPWYSFWIGLRPFNDQPTTIRANFRWLGTGLAPTYTNWGTGEPNNAGGSEGVCIYQQTSGLWNDGGCAGVRPFGCDLPGGL